MTFTAQYPGTCAECFEPIEPGDTVTYKQVQRGRFVIHETCPDPEPLPAVRPGEVSCPDCFLIHPEGACDL